MWNIKICSNVEFTIPSEAPFIGNEKVYDTSVVLYIYDTDEEGELLDQYNLGKFTGGNKVLKEYDMSSYSENASVSKIGNTVFAETPDYDY